MRQMTAGRWLAKMAVACLLLSGCATTKTAHVKKQKPKHGRFAGTYGLYSAKSLDKSILKRGQKNLGSNAMDAY